MPNGDANYPAEILKNTKAYLASVTHVEIFLKAIKPLLLNQFVEGYNCGSKEAEKEK